MKDGQVKKKENRCHFPTHGLKIGKGLYKLYAVVHHSGNPTSGHYTATCYDETRKG